MKKIYAVLLAIAVFVPAGSAFAAVYQYVNNAGEVKTVEANNATSALALAHDLGRNSGVLLVSGEPQYATTTPTTIQYVADLEALIDNLRAQLAVLQAQLAVAQGSESSSSSSRDTVSSMAAPAKVQMTAEEKEAKRVEEKEKATARGVGRFVARVYSEEGKIVVEASDYFEGDTVSVSAKDADGAAVSIKGDAEECGGKVAGIETKLCKKTLSFDGAEDALYTISITYADETKEYVIKTNAKGTHLYW